MTLKELIVHTRLTTKEIAAHLGYSKVYVTQACYPHKYEAPLRTQVAMMKKIVPLLEERRAAIDKAIYEIKEMSVQ